MKGKNHSSNEYQMTKLQMTSFINLTIVNQMIGNVKRSLLMAHSRKEDSLLKKIEEIKKAI